MAKKIFTSAFILNFKETNLTIEYNKFNTNSLRLANKILGLIYFAFQLADAIPFGVNSDKIYKEKRELYYWVLSLKIIFILLEVGLIISAFIVKTFRVHRFISIFNYILYFLLTMSMKITGQIYYDIKYDYFNCILFSELLLICLWHFFRLIEFIESIFINIIFLFISMLVTFLSPHRKSSIDEGISSGVMIIGIIFSAYMITREAKRSFYFFNQLETKNKWYENILNNLNTGFIHFKNNKIVFMNDTLIDKLHTLNQFESYFIKGKNNVVSEEQSREILDFIISNIIGDSDNNNSKINKSISKITQIEMNKSEPIGQLINHNHDSSTYAFDLIKSFCLKENQNGNFTYIGRGNIIYDNKANIIEDNYDQDNPNIYPQMIYEVHARYEKEGESYQIIFDDITRTKSFEEKSAEFKFKNLLLAKIAHEFKNPLICIMELILQLSENKGEKSDNSSLIDKTKMIKAFGDYLLILIKDLDYFSSSELKKSTPLSISDVLLTDVFDLIKEIAIALIKKNKKEKNVVFIPKISKTVSINQIRTDDIKLKQILTNLISNSIKFTTSGYIKLKCSLKEDNYLRFSVEDTGIGIKETVRKYIFTPFMKFEKKNNHLGTGLGLSIVYDLTNKLGKGIQFESEYNKGSKFWFSIPFSYKNDSLMESEKTLYQYNLDLAIPISKELNKRNSPLKMLKINKRKLTVIIADDEDLPRKSTIRIIKEIIQKKNVDIEVLEAEDGIETLSYIYKYYFQLNKRIDAIISDETMKFIEGMKCAEILYNSSHSCNDIPFFLVTAYEGIHSKKTLKGIYTKPLKLIDGETIINSLLHQSLHFIT